MSDGQSVLVIGGLSETEEVLKAIFEPQGLQVNRIRGTAFTEKKQDHKSPNVVVIDADTDRQDRDQCQHWSSAPRVVIGSAQCHSSTRFDQSSADQYLQKPFQYGELIRAIERLLDQSNL